MDDVLEVFAKGVMGIFAIGAVGCLITIPIVAFKFLKVLFERDQDENGQPNQEGVPREQPSA